MVKYLILTVLACIAAVFIFLVLAVNDDKRWFHQFSHDTKNSNSGTSKFDSLQYSAYRWRTNLQTQEWELFLAYYIKIDRHGHYLTMRHNTTPEPAEYFEGETDSLTRRLLDSLFIMPLDTAYVSPELRVYDGNTFRLTYAKFKAHDIDFLQIDAPPFLQRLSTTLDTVILKSNQTTKPFDLSSYEKDLKTQSLKRLGGLPKLQKAPLIKMNFEKFKSAPNRRQTGHDVVTSAKCKHQQ